MDSFPEIYLAASKNDVAELEKLLEQKNPDDVENILSKVCMELQINRVHLSEDTKLLLETKLLSYRFLQQPKHGPSSSYLSEQIQFVKELIEKLDSLDGEQLITNLILIAKIVFTLKKPLRPTYVIVPWEEIEFCVLAYIITLKEQNEFVFFARAILNKSKIISYLESFSKGLDSVTMYVKNPSDKKFNKKTNLQREEVVEEVLKEHPEFTALYNDHERVRDVHSLYTILKYVQYVDKIEDDEDHGVLVVIRALQVIGEHLNNTVESPKLSRTTIDYLFAFFEDETRSIVIKLRNALIHQKSYTRINNFVDRLDPQLIRGIKSDITKIGRHVQYILSKYKMQIVIELGNTFLNTNDENTMKEVVLVMRNFNIKDFQKKIESRPSIDHDDDITKLKNLINLYQTKMKMQHGYTKVLFSSIDQMLNSNSMSIRIDTKILASLYITLNQFYITMENSTNKSSYIRRTKEILRQRLKNISPKIQPLQFNTIGTILMEINNFSADDELELRKIFHEIIHILKFEASSIPWTERFDRKLQENKTQIVPTFSELGDVDIINKGLSHLRLILNGYTYSQFKMNGKVQSKTELLLIDLIPVLEYCNKQTNFIMHYIEYPTIIGRDLRNHLAHNNVMIEVLTETNLAVFLFAQKLLQNAEKPDLYPKELPLLDTGYIRSVHANTFNYLNRKQNLFMVLAEENTDAVTECLKGGADIRSRGIDMSTCLHLAMKKPNTVEITKFLRNEGLSVKLKNSEEQTPLHIAVMNSNRKVTKYLLENFDSAVNEADFLERLPIHLAAFSGNMKIIKLLQDHGADLFKMDCIRHSPLKYAVLSGRPEGVDFFLNRIPPQKLNDFDGGLTALHLAAEYGLIEMVDHLILKSLDVDARTDFGRTPLQLAAMHDHVAVVIALIRAGANVNSCSIIGRYPLHFACEIGNEDIVKELIENGADINVTDIIENYTPLHLAASNGHLNILKILMKVKANIDIVLNNGLTPFLCAVQGNHLNIVKEFFEYKNINLNDKDTNGMTALHLAVKNGAVKTVQLLLKKGACSNCVGRDGLTPLHLAAAKGEETIVDILLVNNASVHAKTEIQGILPLHLAALSGNMNIILKLLEKGSEVNALTSYGENCLHFAAQTENNVLSLLIRRGIDINAKTRQGLTPLHVAVLSSSLGTVKDLIEAGSDVNAQDNSKNTALHLSIERNNQEMFELLLNSDKDIELINTLDNSPFISAVKCNRLSIVELILIYGGFNTTMGCHILPCSTANKVIMDAMKISIEKGNKKMVKLLLDKTSGHCEFGQNELLDWACFHGRSGIVEQLLSYYSDEKYNISTLFTAVVKGYDEIVEILLRNGEQLNAQNDKGLTLLHVASHHNNEKIVKMLIEKGADVNIKNNENRLPVEVAIAEGHMNLVKIFLHKNEDILKQKRTFLIIAAENGHVEMMRYLLEDEDTRIDDHIDSSEDKQFDGLLHYAVLSGKVEAVKYLVEHGHNINSLDDAGLFPLDIAASRGDENLTEYLLNNGAIYNNNRSFISHHAIRNMLSSVDKLFSYIKTGDKTNVLKLIDEGVAMNCKDANHTSPLHLAVSQGHVDIVEILLQKKVSVNEKDKDGWTPLHHASKNAYIEIVLRLLWHEAKYNIETHNGETPIYLAMNNSIRDLFRKIDNCFELVSHHKKEITNRLKKIKTKDVIKAVMRAQNKDGMTLIALANKNAFSELNQLEEQFQANVEYELVTVERLISEQQFQVAMITLHRIYEQRADMFGESNPATLKIKIKIASVLYYQQLYDQARENLEDICEKLQKCLGDNHELTLLEKSFLAVVCLQGKNEDSKELIEEVCQYRKDLSISSSKEAFDTALNVAFYFRRIGELEKSFKIYNEALNVVNQKFGYPYIFIIKHELALILNGWGRYAKALDLLKEVHEGRKSMLGPYHPDTLRSDYHQICVLFQYHQEYDEVLEKLRQLLAIQREHLGLQNVDTLITHQKIADILLEQNKSISAYGIYKEVKHHMVDQLGCNHKKVQDIDSRLEQIFEQYDFLKDVTKHIYKAAKNGKIDIIRTLTECGIDVMDRDEKGRNYLHYAADGNSLNCIKFYMEHGQDLTIKTDKGNTALHISCNRGYKDIAQFLLDNVECEKLNNLLNTATNIGRKTALHIAVEHGFSDIVKLLLKKGALYDCVDNNGKKPIDVARNDVVIKILNTIQEIFSTIQKKDFDKVFSLLKNVENDELECIMGTKNYDNLTIINLLISEKQHGLARNLFVLMKNSGS